jgi:hypothetical protein
MQNKMLEKPSILIMYVFEISTANNVMYGVNLGNVVNELAYIIQFLFLDMLHSSET